MIKGWGLPLAACVLLAGCGGGGGNGPVASAGSSAPPPAPTNGTLTNLQYSQSFVNDSASHAATFNLTSSEDITGSSTKGSLTISYDASAKSYTVSAGGLTQTFLPSEITTSDNTQTVYKTNSGQAGDYLTLVKSPYSGTTSPQYVAMGYWQHNSVDGSTQSTTFDSFAYGLDTPATAVPRTGQAAFQTSVFGITTIPGYQPQSFQGSGRFDVDFLTGIFTTDTSVTESALVSGASDVGGGVELTGGGQLSSSDGTFSGYIHYGGENANASGTLSGRFYGPNGQELGASFSANGTNGSSVTGSLTGALDSTLAPVNLTLTNVVTTQLFYPTESLLTTTTGGAFGFQVRDTSLITQLDLHTSNNFEYGPGTSLLPGGSFTVADEVAGSDPDFVSYQKTINGQLVSIDMYKPGSANSELALTYTSFGRWSSSFLNGALNETDQDFFVYGLDTPLGVIQGRSGTAHYAGVAYGAGANQASGVTYNVTGQSSFDVDFGKQTYMGSLALAGTGSSGSVNFGSYGFSGQIAANTTTSTSTLTQSGDNSGTLTTRFFGPTGQEIGGNFALSVLTGHAGAGTTIAGVAVAKQQ